MTDDDDVQLIRESPTKKEILENYLHGEQKNMGLVLECKTRWSSLADSLAELALLQSLSTSLNIVKATVEALCQEKANLLTAETVLQFMVVKLEATDSFISNRLLDALKNRIA